MKKTFILIILFNSCVSFGWTEYRITISPADQTEPSISSQTVVWTDARHTTNNMDIYGANISDINIPVELQVAISSGNEYRPSISGNIIAYEANNDVYYHNITTGISTKLTNTQTASAAKTDGYTIVWRSGLSSTQRTIEAYDLVTDSFYRIKGVGNNNWPDVDGRFVVWLVDNTKLCGFDLGTLTKPKD
jgi:beta propeller repeat protein